MTACSFTTSPLFLFTSESVAEGHPDKICDQIADAILDCIIKQDPTARVAVEAAVTNGVVMVMGEITTTCYVEIQKSSAVSSGTLAIPNLNTALNPIPVAFSSLSTSNRQIFPWA